MYYLERGYILREDGACRLVGLLIGNGAHLQSRGENLTQCLHLVLIQKLGNDHSTYSRTLAGINDNGIPFFHQGGGFRLRANHSTYLKGLAVDSLYPNRQIHLFQESGCLAVVVHDHVGEVEGFRTAADGQGNGAALLSRCYLAVLTATGFLGYDGACRMIGVIFVFRGAQRIVFGLVEPILQLRGIGLADEIHYLDGFRFLGGVVQEDGADGVGTADGCHAEEGQSNAQNDGKHSMAGPMGLAGLGLTNLAEHDMGIFLQTQKMLQHFLCVLIAIHGIFLHRPHNDLFQTYRQRVVYLAGRLSLFIHLHQGYGYGAVRIKGKTGTSHLVHKHTQRVQIAAGVDGMSAGLLGADIVYGTDGLIGHRNGFCIGQLGNAEVHHLNQAVLQKHNVLRLDVAVNDALGMSVFQRIQNLFGVADDFSDREDALAGHIILQRNAFHVLHDDILYVVPYGNVVNIHDVGMGEHSDGFGFVDEATDALFIRSDLIPQHFYGHDALHEQIDGLVYHGHTANANDFIDFVSVVEDDTHVSFKLIHPSIGFLFSSFPA